MTTTKSTPAVLRARFTRQLIKPAFCILAGLALLAPAVNAQVVYMMQFNQANNRFGTFDLSTGVFTQQGTVGSTLFNDIAGAADGSLWGIVNANTLVSININSGSILSSVSFNVPNIQSFAFAPNGTLYGATQGALYTINRVNGQASLVGNFNNSLIGNRGQNIRFGMDGNLYVTDGGVNATNTHLFQLSLTTGAASTMGVITNFPGLCLENAGGMMYGVGISLGAAASLQQNLLAIDYSSFRLGGTNTDGSVANIGYYLVSPSFPNNFNFTSSNTFVVPGSPIPEPGTLGICLAGGAWILHQRRTRVRRS